MLSEVMYDAKGLEKVDALFGTVIDLWPDYAKEKGRVQKVLDQIASIVDDKFNMTQTKIYIVNNYGEAFGMRVYPSKEELAGITNKVVDMNAKDIKFERITKIVIEIDSHFLNGTFCKPTPRMMTGVLLHEIGHKIFSDYTAKVFNKMHWIFLLQFSGSWAGLLGGIGTLEAGKKKAALAIFVSIPIMLYFTGMWQGKMYNKIEIASDSFPARLGYGAEVEQFLAAAMKAWNMPEAPNDDDKWITRMVKWIKWNMNHLAERRRAILALLQDEYNKTSSPYEKELLQSQIDILKRK